MLIRNKSEAQDIGVTNKDNVVQVLKPGESCEVDDGQGRGYLANYPQVFEKVDVAITDDEKDAQLATQAEQIKTLTKLVERLTKWERIDELDKDEEELIANAEAEEVDEEEEKAELIAELKEAGVKWVGSHRSLTKLRKSKESL